MITNYSSTFFSNLDYLLKRDARTISDLELYLANITETTKKGYFSRLRPSAEKEGKLPSIDILMLLSEYFHVPLDNLIKDNLQFTPKIIFQLEALLSKLHTLTISNNLNWEFEQNTINHMRHLPFYRLKSTVPNLGIIIIELLHNESLNLDYYTVYITDENSREEKIIFTTPNNGCELIPYVSLLCNAALIESQQIEVEPDIYNKIHTFLGE